MLVINRNVVKLADFGFSYRPSYEDLLAKWLPRTLTPYSSPEIVNFRKNTNGEYEKFSLFASDIYALSTALFLAIYKRPPIIGPFPTVDDQYYQLLINDPDLFWSLDFIQHADNQLIREHIPRILLENLKDLLEGGLAEEDNRITISEFVNHDFFK
jgi:serine/threonine protein kinase